jgi:FlaA1/EpsC-like NDP-sugar epimerase
MASPAVTLPFPTTNPNRKPLWRLLTGLILLSLTALAFVGAFWLRFDFELDSESLRQIGATLPVLVVLRLMCSLYFRLDRRPLNTVSVPDLVPIILSIVAGSALFAPYALWALPGLAFPRSVLLIDCLLLNVMALALFSSSRVLSEVRAQSDTAAKRVVVVGDGPALMGVLRDVKASQRWVPVGIAMSDGQKQGFELLGVRVEGSPDEVVMLAQRAKADLVCFANPGLGRRKLLELTAACRAAGQDFVVLRSRSAVPDGPQSQMDDVTIEVILQREEVEIDLEAIRRFIRGKRVLVTGAGGSIGSELCRQIARFQPGELYLMERAENNLFYINREVRQLEPGLNVHALLVDITDEVTVEREFQRVQPQLVFHAAAFKHVGMMEQRPYEAIRNNVVGTTVIARAAIHCGTERFINVSTDKAVRPKSYMGLSKRLAEMVIHELNEKQTATRFSTVRFGNVAGSTGSVVRLFREQIMLGGPVTVTDRDAERFFMSIPEAVRLVLQAAVYGDQGGIFMLEMGHPVKIYDLAKTMIALAGYVPDVDIPIQFTGLGAAEKMTEELCDDDEQVNESGHGRIRRLTKIAGTRQAGVLARVDDWKERLRAGEAYGVLGELHEVWPETTQVNDVTSLVGAPVLK